MKLGSKQAKEVQKYINAYYEQADRQRLERCAYYNDQVMRYLHGDVSYDNDAADERRAEADKLGLITALPDQLLRLGDASLRELSNDLVAIMMPVDTPYAGVPADPQDKDKVKGMLSICRAYASYNRHRGNAIDATYNWLALQGCVIHGVFEDESERPQESEFAGVVFYSKDPYACFWDVGAKLIHASRKAAIFGWHERVTAMEVYMDQERLEDYTLPKADEAGTKRKTHNNVTIPCPTNYQRAYRKKYQPSDASSGLGAYDTGTDVFDLLSAFGADATRQGHALTRTTMYVRIPSEVFGSALTTYKLTFLNGELVHITEEGDARQSFPIIGGAPHLEHDHTSYHGYGEHAAAANRMVSAQMNLIKRGMRREAVGGTTFVDKTILGGRSLRELESEGNRYVEVSVPASANGEKSLGSYVLNTGAEGVSSRMSEAQQFCEFYSQKMFPRSARADVANLDRATAMHAMLAAGSADGSLLSLAIMLDETLGVPMRSLLKRLIIQHKGVIKVVDPKMREFIAMDAAELRTLEFEFTPSQPMAGFDRNRVLMTIEQMLNYLIQTPQIQQDPGRIEGLLNYMMEVASASTVSLEDFDIALQNGAIDDTTSSTQGQSNDQPLLP